jgi:drug/metabolite transporter (DMT)-like permease
VTLEALPAPAPRRPAHFGAAEWGWTALLAVVWGASFLFIRIGVDTFGAGLVPAMRIGFGALAMAVIPASWRPIARADWPAVAALGILWMAVPFLLYAWGEQTVPTAIAGMINGAVPLISATIAAVLHRRAPSLLRVFALALGVAGVSVIAVSAAHDSGAASSAGVLMLLVAVLCFGISANITPGLQRRYGAAPVLLRAQIVAFVASVPYGVFTARTASFSWSGLACMVVLGALGTGLAHAVYATLLGRTDSTRGAIGLFLIPVVATLLGVVFRHEHMSAAVLLGAALVLAGAVLTSRPEPE